MYNPQLRVFVCVADCGSFNKAAEKLFLSPPSVMKQINALEKHLDLQLLSRTNHGIHLTPAGQVIYRQAKKMFELSELSIEEARKISTQKKTTFYIGSSLLNPCKPFMDLWYQFTPSLAGFRLHIIPFEDDHTGILSEIGALGDKFDFLIGVCDSKLWLNRCNFLPLGSYQHCVAMPRDHRLASKKRLTIKDLYGETLMMVRPGDSSVVDSLRKELERHPQITVKDTHPFYDIEVFNQCEQSRNLMLSIECWKDVHPALTTLPVDWDFPIPYGILYPLHPSLEIRHFIQLVTDYLSQS